MPTAELGRLWWTADTLDELKSWQLEAKGATYLKIDPVDDAPRIHVVFELPKAHAKEILGYTPEDSEWLEEYDPAEAAHDEHERRADAPYAAEKYADALVYLFDALAYSGRLSIYDCNTRTYYELDPECPSLRNGHDLQLNLARRHPEKDS